MLYETIIAENESEKQVLTMTPDSKLRFKHGSITYDFLPDFFWILFCDRDVLLFIFNSCSNEEKPK